MCLNMICKYYGRKVELDMEQDLIHNHLDNKGVDARMCKPNNPDSKIAEVSNAKDN